MFRSCSPAMNCWAIVFRPPGWVVRRENFCNILDFFTTYAHRESSSYGNRATHASPLPFRYSVVLHDLWASVVCVPLVTKTRCHAFAVQRQFPAPRGTWLGSDSGGVRAAAVKIRVKQTQFGGRRQQGAGTRQRRNRAKQTQFARRGNRR